MKKIAMIFALAALVTSAYAGGDDEKAKKGERKSCCTKEGGAKSCGSKGEAKADAKTKGDTKTAEASKAEQKAN